MKAARKTNATTQRFIEIADIIDDLVILQGNQAAMVLEITATNFALQSTDEQGSKILSYASLLNSLSFPIQISIVSRKLDVSTYINLLDEEQQKTGNPKLAEQIGLYKKFVSELVHVNTVLDKKFYVTLSYSFLEQGAKGVTKMADSKTFAPEARRALKSKAASLSQGLIRLGIKSKILGKEELTDLYYEVFNSEGGHKGLSDTAPMVKGLK